MMQHARSHWRRGHHCLAIARLVFFAADTLTVRLLLAWASGVYAVLLVWPEISNAVRHAGLWLSPALEALLPAARPSIFARPAFAIMALFPGGVWLWFGLFMGHMVGVHWRVLDPVERKPWALAINVLGLAVWAYSTLSLVLSMGMVLPTSALEVVVIFFSFWVMVRTGLTNGILSE